MKVLIVGDVHWSEYASIVRKRGPKYSKRLENLINSVNWVEATAEEYNCDMIIFLGDFFDKSELNAAEVTALQEVVWARIPHIYLVGNHEEMLQDLSTSSAHFFNSIPYAKVIDEPTFEELPGGMFVYIPYILEEERKPLTEYIPDTIANTFVFSHNDIKGINFGHFESKEGFEVSEIEEHCDRFFNGHLHNGTQFCKNGFNIGNLTGQNFSEDASKYEHKVCVFETEDYQQLWLENPYALNFYKFEINDINTYLRKIKDIKNNSVVTIKVPEDSVADIKKLIAENDKIIEYRIICVPNKLDSNNQKENVVIESVNHLDQFVQYIKDNLEMTDIIVSELSEVCKCN